MNGQGVWVYAVTDRDDREDLSWPAGVGGTRVQNTTVAGLTVLVSHVDLAEFGEEALRANLEDLEWLEEAARAHHGVVEAAAGEFAVLPTRFATVYSSDAAMAAEFDGRGEELRAALRRVRGCVEWGVKAYAAGQTGQETDDGTAPASDSRGGADAGGAGGAGAGMTYLKRRRAALSAREESRRTLAASAQAVHAELRGQALQARLYPPQSPALSGSRTPMLLNASYLLASSVPGVLGGTPGTQDFAAAVAVAAAAHPDLRLDLSGPWPPYSFIGQDG